MIGIFGGTFDPIHYGHLRAALEVKERFRLAEIRFIISAKPPHRDAPSVSVDHRLAMLERAIQTQNGFVADTREIVRPGPSFMVLTLESLRQEHPDKPLLLFIGTDAFNRLDTWHQWQRLFDLAHVVVITRPGYETGHLGDYYRSKISTCDDDLAASPAGKLAFQPITLLDISATIIRGIIAQGGNPRFLLPENVLTYINENHLYINTTDVG